MRTKYLIILNLLLACLPLGATYMNNASDSLFLLPKPLLGLDNGALRYGFQFSVMKTLIHHRNRFCPYLETGLTLFNRIEGYPDENKHFFLKFGLLKEFGPITLSLESGLLYGNGHFGPTSGIGIWKFIPFVESTEKKSLKDFPDYASYVKWRNRYLRSSRKLVKGCAISARVFYNYSIAPSLTGGIFFDLFL